MKYCILSDNISFNWTLFQFRQSDDLLTKSTLVPTVVTPRYICFRPSSPTYPPAVDVGQNAQRDARSREEQEERWSDEHRVF